MTIHYGIPTYNQFQRCKDAIEHIIATSSVIPDQFVVIDNSEHGLALPVLQPLVDEYKGLIQVIPRKTNILAGAWNDLMNLYGRDYMILANDDVLPHKDTIANLVLCAHSNPEYAIVNGAADSGNSYSFLIVKQWAYKQIGPFDEAFLGGYFEDNDYDRRKDLLGLIRHTCMNATYEHYGSATMRGMDDQRRARHNLMFERNRDLFVRKWGGMPNQARYTIPYERDEEEPLDDE